MVTALQRSKPFIFKGEGFLNRIKGINILYWLQRAPMVLLSLLAALRGLKTSSRGTQGFHGFTKPKSKLDFLDDWRDNSVGRTGVITTHAPYGNL